MTGPFSWNDSKRISNVKEYKTDVADAAEIFSAEHLILPDRSDVETRLIAVSALSDQIIAVVFTLRDDVIRIISARKARTDER